jgi:protocatechuate 3,4-dioxygenase beta subunit
MSQTRAVLCGAAAGSDAAASQDEISGEIATIAEGYARAGVPETRTRLDYAPYRSSVLRHPTNDTARAEPETIERFSPVFGERDVSPIEADLTAGHAGEPIGERVVLAGRVTDGEGRPVAGQLVEIWQANAAGRYIHQRDRHPAPLDPNFTGLGRALTDSQGRYRFVTIKPGPYPWKNHRNAWRPAHIHFSLFGTCFPQRLVTQMYFPGDPLFSLDPIFTSVLDPRVRELMIAAYDHGLTEPEFATGYRWDIVLCGARRTPLEEEGGAR